MHHRYSFVLLHLKLLVVAAFVFLSLERIGENITGFLILLLVSQVLMLLVLSRCQVVVGVFIY